MEPTSSFDTSIFALPPDDDSDEEAEGADDSVSRTLESSEEEDKPKKGAGLEWTLRTTGGRSRAGVADSFVQQGSVATDDGSTLTQLQLPSTYFAYISHLRFALTQLSYRSHLYKIP
jgi:hypothetical protein